MKFADVMVQDVGKIETVLARIERVHQTPGPTLFVLFDGTGQLTAKGFLKPGKRAYPECVVGDAVQAVLRMQEYEGKVEAEIVAFEKTDSATFEQQLAELQSERIKVGHADFLVKSPWLEKLRGRFEKAAMSIKKAIYEHRPIVVRHNADCDGYSGAIALERAILPLIRDEHKDAYAEWRYYRRAPSRAPFYTYGDATLDMVSAIGDMARNNMKAPLIVIVDNGSGKEDVLGIKKVKVYGCPVIIVDHHFVGEDAVSPLVDVHVNPYLEGYDSRLCSGMLGTELARMVNPRVENVNVLPALAGMGDKVQGDEMGQYVALAAKEGYDSAYLKQIALCVDFEAHALRFVEGRGLVDDLLGADKEKQKKTAELLYPEAQARIEKILAAVEKYMAVRKEFDKVVVRFDVDKVLFVGEFPPFGKVTGRMCDRLIEKHKKGVYVLGVSEDMLVVRVSNDEMRFNVNAVVEKLRREKPYACVSGGGHERAGTIRFVPAAKAEVVAFVEECILHYTLS